MTVSSHDMDRRRLAEALSGASLSTHRLYDACRGLWEKMRDTVDGDASLLDKTAIIWGSPMGDPNLHNHRRNPLLLIGRANGALEGGLHLRAAEGTPMANVFVSLMQKIGHEEMTTFGDATGEFSLEFGGIA